MMHQDRTPMSESIGVSLVDGDTEVRHARQLLLRSENYDVRSYPTGAALLADPEDHRSCRVIVLDIDTQEDGGFALLREMRATGWRGKAILLEGSDPDATLARQACCHSDKIFDRAIGDRPLLIAIAASIDRSCERLDR